MLYHLRALPLVGLFFILLVGQYFLGRSLDRRSAPWVEPPFEKKIKWNVPLFKALSFGHVPAAVDWLWILSLQDLNLTKVRSGERAAIFYDLDLGTDLDPRNFEMVYFGAMQLTATRHDGESAKDLLLKGEKFRTEVLPQASIDFQEKYWPDAFSIPYLLGYVYLFELKDLPKASLYYRRTAGLPGAPFFLERLKNSLSTKRGQYEVGIRHLQFSLKRLDDPILIKNVEKQLRNLQIGYFIFDLNDRFQKFLNQRKPTSSQWRIFQNQFQIPGVDPWGGRIFLSQNGQIDTETERETVYEMN